MKRTESQQEPTEQPQEEETPSDSPATTGDPSLRPLRGYFKDRIAKKCHGVTRRAKTAIAVLLACVTMWHSSGCAVSAGYSKMANGMGGMMEGMGKAGEALAEKISDEGVLKDWLVNVDGHLQDPGFAAYTQITVQSGVKATGMNGNLVASGHGDSTRLPAGVRESLLKELDDPRTPPERKDAILTILGWNRTATGGNPNGG